MDNDQTLSTSASRYQRIALIVGVIGIIAGIAGAVTGNLDRFFQSYLFAFLFWLGIALGSLGFLLLHFLTGGRWGLTVRRILEAAASTLWLLAILFIPLLVGMPSIFPWMHPLSAPDLNLQFKSAYLTVPFFIGRAVVYFAIWILMAWTVNRLSARWTETGDPEIRGRLQGWGAVGIILYFLTMTFAATDWMMSINPYWHSTIYGMLVVIGQVLTALSFAILMLNLFPSLGLGRTWTFRTTPVPYQDLGGYMITLVMSWAYLAFFQLLIQWAGNLPREVAWYVDRTQGGWLPVGIFVALFEFVIPFSILLTIRIRHNLRLLAGLAAVLVITYLVNLYWQIIPAYHPGQFSLSWLDIALPIGLGGLWIAMFLAALKRRPQLREQEQAALAPKLDFREHGA